LRSTKLGTYWLAIGNNEDSARKIGVPVRRAKLAAYAFCGVSAAPSGILLSAYLGEITTFTFQKFGLKPPTSVGKDFNCAPQAL
jgi:ribose/xylose/arabinose/galactoside ABC-type transport system permease subunit